MRQRPPRRFVFLRVSVTSLVLLALFASLQAPSANAQPAITTTHTFTTNQPVIALTFDVTFDRGRAGEVLDILANRGVRATFAITGTWAQSNPDLIRRMVNEGHQLMNHTWDHYSLTGEYTGSKIHEPTEPLSRDEIISQLRRTENFIRDLVGVNMAPYVRPPYGDYTAATLEAMAAAGYTQNIMWTVDTHGWYLIPPNQARDRALDAAQPGANILMHIGHGSTDVDALPGIIDGLRSRGYSFATVRDFVEGNFAGTGSMYFPQTSQELSGNFKQYWLSFGGLSVFGYPISPTFEQNGVTTQYFERARFELHPGSQPSRFNVQLGRLGAEVTDGRGQEDPFQPVQAESNENCTFFPQTGHTLCHGFRDYWEEFGGLGVYGYPISQEFIEVNADTGEAYVVQYFERQRFEWHPGEWPERHDVLLGRLGAELHEGGEAASANTRYLVHPRQWPKRIATMIGLY